MKIRIAAVCSADGKLTRGDDPDITEWISAEDHYHFMSLIASHEVIVMGRKTYEAARHTFKRNPTKRRIIVTRKPQKFDGEAGEKMEFTAETPQEITTRLDREGISQVLIVGGGQINAVFLQAGLVDELYLTIEPLLFGGGVNLAGDLPLKTSLKLLSSKQLNDNGTILLHYAVK